MMWKDPIVQETRQLREAFAAQHGNDADSIFDAILKQQNSPEKTSLPYSKMRQAPSESLIVSENMHTESINTIGCTAGESGPSRRKKSSL